MWQFCWLVAFFFHGMRAMTQSLTGRVVDERERPLISVSLTLYNPADSSRVGGAVSGEDGGFSIPVAEGSYLLRASEMGYEEIDTVVASFSPLILRMQEKPHLLGEVKIQGVRPTYRMVSGGVSIDVRSSGLAQASDALDVLCELPRVNVDGKGGISVSGKSTPLVYINHRLVRDAKELNRLKSREIKSVEVITSPGAKYDASASSVIRINTTKKVGEGWSFLTENNIKTNFKTKTCIQIAHSNIKVGSINCKAVFLFYLDVFTPLAPYLFVFHSVT